jgi:glycosyltransferase involved in cell wall biosynthesis
MAADRPSVSAVITAHDSARYIADALASIRAQRFPPDEIIIIDDGSTDGTGVIVKALGPDIRYVFQTNRGEAAARNRGVAEAQSEVVAFLDADDAWPIDRLARLVQPLKDSRIDIVCGRARAFGEESWMAAAAADANQPEGFMMSFGCAVIRRSVFHQIGGVDETMRHGVDLDWFFRCRERDLPILVIENIVLLYRRHERNMTLDVAAGRDGLMRTVKQSLDRRRRAERDVRSLPLWETLGRDRA